MPGSTTTRGQQVSCDIATGCVALYGVFFVKEFRQGGEAFLRRFLGSISKPVSSSRPAHRRRRCAQNLYKVGCHPNLAACFALARPYHDSFEHDGTLSGRDDDQRGARFRARFSRAATLYWVGPRTRTMMQSCASAAKLRSGEPILPFGMKAKGHLGIPPPRTVIGVRHKRTDRPKLSGAFSVLRSLCRTKNDAVRDNALPHEPPQGDQQLARQGHDHGLSVPRAFSVRDRNHFVKALFFWCRRNRHAN